MPRWQSEGKLQTELGQRLDESEGRCVRVSEQLRLQRAKYDLLLTTRRRVEDELQRMESNLGSVGDKVGEFTIETLNPKHPEPLKP